MVSNIGQRKTQPDQLRGSHLYERRAKQQVRHHEQHSGSAHHQHGAVSRLKKGICTLYEYHERNQKSGDKCETHQSGLEKNMDHATVHESVSSVAALPTNSGKRGELSPRALAEYRLIEK